MANINQQSPSFHHLLQQQHHQLQLFWSAQRREIEEVVDFKTHTLPLARIKKIMKADEDVRMISAEAPVLFAKACELFVLELTIRSWLHAEENKRRTLQKNDIAAAITRTDIFDFLVDIVPSAIIGRKNRLPLLKSFIKMALFWGVSIARINLEMRLRKRPRWQLPLPGLPPVACLITTLQSASLHHQAS